MKTETERQFLRYGRRREWMLRDSLIALRPREYCGSAFQLEGAKSLIFDVIDIATHQTAGEIALRIGEGKNLFYLGHIGYHIDPPFRGKGEAQHACQLCLSVFRDMGMRTVVITTDEGNAPSIRTCEKLGCVLESTINVPVAYQNELSISAKKRRYILFIPEK